MINVLHYPSDADRLYLPRKTEGHFLQTNHIVQQEKTRVYDYIKTSEETSLNSLSQKSRTICKEESRYD